MGKQSKLRRTRRIRKELGEILEEGLDTGKLVEDDTGDFKFQDPEMARQFFTRVMSNPEIFYEFVEDNPNFLPNLLEAMAADDDEIIDDEL